MTPETPLTPETISGDPRQHSGNSGRYIIPELLEPPKPEHVRILLSEAASKHLTDTGESVFMVIAKATHPEDPTRWVIHLVPIPKAQADGASRVALGTHKAVKIKTTVEP